MGYIAVGYGVFVKGYVCMTFYVLLLNQDFHVGGLNEEETSINAFMSFRLRLFLNVRNIF